MSACRNAPVSGNRRMQWGSLGWMVIYEAYGSQGTPWGHGAHGAHGAYGAHGVNRPTSGRAATGGRAAAAGGESAAIETTETNCDASGAPPPHSLFFTQQNSGIL